MCHCRTLEQPSGRETGGRRRNRWVGSSRESLDQPVSDLDGLKSASFKKLAPLALFALTAIHERQHHEVDDLRVVGRVPSRDDRIDDE